jgi:hypothetical protein
VTSFGIEESYVRLMKYALCPVLGFEAFSFRVGLQQRAHNYSDTVMQTTIRQDKPRMVRAV